MKIFLKIIAIILIVFGLIVIIGAVSIMGDKPEDTGINIAITFIFGVIPLLFGVFILIKKRGNKKIGKLEKLDTINNNVNDIKIDKIDTLLNAIGTGEVIKIKYNGGSQPETIREIVPMEINGKLLNAYCVASEMEKSFTISKIDIVSNDANVSFKLGKIVNINYTSEESKVEYRKKLKEVYDTNKENWEQNGWYVAFDDLKIGLHNFGKRGKPLKYPVFSISYCGTDDDWRIWSTNENCYKYLDKAINGFLKSIK